MTEEPNTQKVDPHLLQLILSLESAAMQLMGKLQNPLSGKVEMNLDLAKNSIDLLAMIERKTEGNLTDTEQSLIRRVLYQLRMNYVDESKSEKRSRQTGNTDEPTGDDNEKGTDAGEESNGATGSKEGEPEQPRDV